MQPLIVAALLFALPVSALLNHTRVTAREWTYAVLLAVALAVPPKRSTSGVGVFLAIVMVVTYHKINEYAAGMGAIGTFDPFFALWVPFFLFAALIVWMYWRVAYVPGGQAIGALEAAFSILAIRDQIAPPTINLDNQDPEIDLDVVAGGPRPGNYEYAINNSFGFGGHNVALAFGKY